ncbi:MAG TPA: BBP7 family outer membrane beta-barrel protein [Pirellula sp.]|nr:BBP7 family outer membrane beta-barrel protein [Pirellula sp.]
MKLLKGWKLRLIAGMAFASLSVPLQAQKPGSLDPRSLGYGPQIGPASYQIPGPPPGMSNGSSMDPSIGMSMDPNLPHVPYDGNPGGCGGQYGSEGCIGLCGGGQCGGACGLGACRGGGRCGGLCGGQCGGLQDRFGRSPFDLLSALRGRLANCRGVLLPYGEGGIATQRWFDISAEAIFLKRTNGGANFNTSSLGAGSNNFVLGTNNVPLNALEPGLALQGNIQVGPGSNLEVVYFGLNRWENSASATSTAPNLFSFLSNFGTIPVNGFDDPDRSFVHTLSYSSTLNNGEINFRRRWAEPAGFFQGSFLSGVRYLDLDEQASFTARGENNNTAANNGLRFLDYTTNTQNSLVGFQVGADLWYNVIPGVKVGVEMKSGVYNNRAHQSTAIIANSLPNSVTEEVLSNRVAYISQIAPQAYYRLNYSWAVRSSYQLIYIDGVALATENFNAAPPTALLNTGRVPRIESDAEIVLQGFTVGAEYTW